MTNRRALHSTGNVLAVAFVAWIGFVTLTSPWHTRWGSTDEELYAALPGDEPLTGAATYWLQHAVTIHAPVSAVWPWLAQLGTGRGGFYSSRGRGVRCTGRPAVEAGTDEVLMEKLT